MPDILTAADQAAKQKPQTDILGLQMQWPALAQDLALVTVPNSPVGNIENVCASYGITRQDLRDLLGLPYFAKLFDVAVQEVNKTGSKAGTRYRAMFLAQSLAESLFRKANSGKMEDKDALKLLESLIKTAGLDVKETTQVNIQNNVSLPLPQGVAKIAHCLPVEG